MELQPLICVADVEASSRWYQQVLGLQGAHGGPEYEMLLHGGRLVLQLHALGEAHHHGGLADPGVPLGNGLGLWLVTGAFDDAVSRAREGGAHVERDVHTNPNARRRELYLRDPDGYLVVLAEG